MDTIKIRVDDFYNKPEYYRFMPLDIFNALELAELKGALNGEEIMAEVSMEQYNRMIDDIKKNSR